MDSVIPIQEMSFPGPEGLLHLRSALPPHGAAVAARLGIIHGYGDHSGRYAEFMRWMAARGVACHAVDLRGQGKSAGRRAYVKRWEDYLEDLRAFVALAPLTGKPGRGRLFLLAHSHGALVLSAGILAGLGSGGVAGCVLTSPFFRNRMAIPRSKLLLGRVMEALLPWLRVPTGVRGEWMSGDADMVAQSDVDPLLTRVATPRWFFGQLKAQERVLASAAGFTLPLLILVGEADPLAEPAGGRIFYERAGSADKTFKAYPNRLHELLREKEREGIFGDVLEWMKGRMG